MPTVAGLAPGFIVVWSEVHLFYCMSKAALLWIVVSSFDQTWFLFAEETCSTVDPFVLWQHVICAFSFKYTFSASTSRFSHEHMKNTRRYFFKAVIWNLFWAKVLHFYSIQNTRSTTNGKCKKKMETMWSFLSEDELNKHKDKSILWFIISLPARCETWSWMSYNVFLDQLCQIA